VAPLGDEASALLGEKPFGLICGERVAGGQAHVSTRVSTHTPDGEVEDVGTTLSVSVQDRHLQRVRVDEGRGTIRRPDASPMTLAGGEEWSGSFEPTLRGRGCARVARRR
jgi:hypothetical protein